jgi:hypothetical protein
MSDLILQGFRKLTGQSLAQTLSDEKGSMFGEQKPSVKEVGGHAYMFTPISRFFSQPRKRPDLTVVCSPIPEKERTGGTNDRTENGDGETSAVHSSIAKERSIASN